METISISNMTPETILVKPAFRRAVPSENMTVAGMKHHLGDAGTADKSEYVDPMRYEIMTQSDFMREYDVNSHKINSVRYYPNPWTKDSEGKYSAKVKSRIAIAFQKRILVKRLTTLVGNNVNLRVINRQGDNENILADFREGWVNSNMELALYEALLYDGMTGDCALCFYMDNGKVGWRSFGFPKGDVLYPHYDPYTDRLTVFGRRYTARDGVERLDVWDDRCYMRYKASGLKGNGPEWTVEAEPTPHGFPRIPICYDRYGAPFWANSQSLIDSYEMAMSQFAENNMAYALRILVTLGESLSLQSTLDGTPTRIDAPSKDANVKYLEPADSSNSYMQQLNIMERNIMRSSFAVETPELKSGSDMSSLTVKMLFADSYQQATLDALHFQRFLDDMVELFKYGYGIQMGKSTTYNSLMIRAEIYPYIFMSETETVTNIAQLCNVGALSKKSASEYAYDLGYGVNGEYSRLQKEDHDDLVGQTFGTMNNTEDEDA